MSLLLWALGIVGAAIVGAVGLALVQSANVFLGLGLPVVVAGGVLLVVATVRGRREAGVVRLRHCLECGASVGETAAVCARCGSVRLEAAAGERAAGGRRGREGRDMPVTALSPDRSGVIGWVDAAPPDSMAAGAETANRKLRLWGIMLTTLGIVLFALGLTRNGA